MEITNQVRQCPHCKNIVVQDILNTGNGAPEIILFPDGKDEVITTFYFLTKCTTCQEISLLRSREYDRNPRDISEATVIYPTDYIGTASLPPAIRESIEEAQKVRRISPVAFSLLLRRALELVCIDRGATHGENLKDQIQNLAINSNLPPSITYAAESLKILRTLGAHTSISSLSPGDVQLLDDLCLIITEYLYVMPGKVAQLEKKLREQNML